MFHLGAGGPCTLLSTAVVFRQLSKQRTNLIPNLLLGLVLRHLPLSDERADGDVVHLHVRRHGAVVVEQVDWRVPAVHVDKGFWRLLHLQPGVVFDAAGDGITAVLTCSWARGCKHNGYNTQWIFRNHDHIGRCTLATRFFWLATG